MNLEARKISFVQEFLRIDNEDIISALENFLRKNRTEVFEQNLKPMSIEKLNQEIDEALEDEMNNRLTSAKNLKQKIEKWT
ncbi:hypothetical protein [Chryseobacterium sp. 2R14A]|uniref:hypothetical protein n=1 Tax=Chryseobacterium sp. 2R14A TaxID=3380353 RepID=UPI003CF6AC8A